MNRRRYLVKKMIFCNFGVKWCSTDWKHKGCKKKSHPMIAYGQRYWMPCLKWLAEKWSECRAAPSKGRCTVGNGGKFPYVLRGHIGGPSGNFSWFSMGILHVFIFHQFSMLFNSKQQQLVPKWLKAIKSEFYK